MYKYETVKIAAKDPVAARRLMDRAISDRFGARLAHVTPFVKPNVWSSASETVALILVFEVKVVE